MKSQFASPTPCPVVRASTSMAFRCISCSVRTIEPGPFSFSPEDVEIVDYH